MKFLTIFLATVGLVICAVESIDPDCNTCNLPIDSPCLCLGPPYQGWQISCIYDKPDQQLPPMPNCTISVITISSSKALHISSKFLANRKIAASGQIDITGNPLTFAPDAFMDFNNNGSYVAYVTLTNKQPGGDQNELFFDGANISLSTIGYHKINLTNSPSLPGLYINGGYDDMQISWPSDGIVKVVNVHSSFYPNTTGFLKLVEMSVEPPSDYPNISPMPNLFPALYEIDYSICTTITIDGTYTPEAIQLPFLTMSKLKSVFLGHSSISRIAGGTFAFPENKSKVELVDFGFQGFDSFGNVIELKIDSGAFKNTGDINLQAVANITSIPSGAFAKTGTIYLNENYIQEIDTGAFNNTGTIYLSYNNIQRIKTGTFTDTGELVLSSTGVRVIETRAFTRTGVTLLQDNHIQKVAKNSFTDTGSVNLMDNFIQEIKTGTFVDVNGYVELARNQITTIEPGAFQNVGSIALQANNLTKIVVGIFDGVTTVYLDYNPITEIEPFAFGNKTAKVTLGLYQGANVSIDAFRLMEGTVNVTLWGDSTVNFTIGPSSYVPSPPKSRAQLSLECGDNHSTVYCPNLDKQICSVLAYFQANPACYCPSVVNFC